MNGLANVEYLGFKSGEELNKIIAEARISICGSEQYENCPFSVIESISYGTPVVGSRMGGIPELIDEGITGELYEAANVDDLQNAIKRALSKVDILTENCYKAEVETSETYYNKLMQIYNGGVYAK